MSGFSPEWLALREPVDHRSRCSRMAARLSAHFGGHDRIDVVDIGCGTGSNLRGTFADLPDRQNWTLVDYDPRLLAAARQALATWADVAAEDGDTLVLARAGKHLRVGFRQADLNADMAAALGDAADLVTASAFFDLCSGEFIGHFARMVADRRAAFFTVLTYNGQQSWTPAHAADMALLEAFIAHQRGDKGFGPAAGPAAPASLSATFQAADYHVAEGDSPWRLGPADAKLIAELAQGFATAAEEAGGVSAREIAAWSAVVRTGAVVGHTDTLALPPPA